jgi:fatty-acyl-CoA synthase
VNERLSRLRDAAEMVALGARVLQKTGLLATLTPRRVASFARLLPGGRRGPHHLLALHAMESPHRVAVVSGDTRHTYRELERRVLQLAHALARLGIRAGDSVAIVLENVSEYLETQLALAHLGATAVHIGNRLRAQEVAYIVANSRARAIVFGAAQEDVVAGALEQDGAAIPPERRIRVGASYEALLAREGRPTRPPPPLPGRATASGFMVYTSGTTGRPKGALRDLSTMGIAPVLAAFAELPIRTDERHLVVCPLYHSSPQAWLIATLSLGGTLVLLPHFDPVAALRLVDFERITSVVVVPTMLARLLRVPAEELVDCDTSSLRWILSGAAPLPTSLARDTERAFGPILYNFYGATETGLVTMARPGEHTARPGTIGRALAGNAIRLLDEAGRDVPEGEVGELWVKNAMLVSGYFGNAQATAEAQREGYFSVGDLARRDSDGYYYLAGRRVDMVISGGVNVYPAEIEAVIDGHPQVAESAVVGVADDEWGEALCAFVALRAGATLDADALRAYVAQRLAGYKKPKHVRFCDALPRNPTGKVDKAELRRRAAA